MGNVHSQIAKNCYLRNHSQIKYHTIKEESRRKHRHHKGLTIRDTGGKKDLHLLSNLYNIKKEPSSTFLQNIFLKKPLKVSLTVKWKYTFKRRWVVEMEALFLRLPIGVTKYIFISPGNLSLLVS